MSGLLSHSKNSIPVWFRLFWRAEELHALTYALLFKYILIFPRLSSQAHPFSQGGTVQ